MQYTTKTISIDYVLKYRFKHCNYIFFTEDLKIAYNFRTSRNIITSNNLKKGFWFKRKFYRLDKIKYLIELIPKYNNIENDFLTNLTL